MKFKFFIFMWLSLLYWSILVAEVKSGIVTFDIELSAEVNSKEAKLWMPYPMSNEYQTISDIKISGNHNTSGIYREPESNSVYLFAEWNKIKEIPSLEMSFHVETMNQYKKAIKDSSQSIPAIISKYLESTESIPANDFKKEADEATKGMNTIADKAYGVYNWVIENTYRDPNVQGCGIGSPNLTLNQRSGGGKCADISAVFVTIARAAGVPAREVYGLRLANPKVGDITSGFHCWAEFYLPGTGWIAVDPADVRKMMLVHNLELKDATEWKSFFWGRDNLFRVVLEKDSRDVVFQPKQSGKPLNYFMYPFGEIDGKSLNHLDPKSFKYSVSFKKDK